MRLDHLVALKEPESSYLEVRAYLRESREILDRLEYDTLDRFVQEFIKLQQRKGRLFVIGSGGSAANASHAVNDFRKLTGIEAYCPSDNVAELTARINDDGWDQSYVGWLVVSKLYAKDLLFTLSVGGGSRSHNVSVNLVNAMKYAKGLGTPIVGIVGRDGGYTKQIATECVVVPTVNEQRITPHVESFQSVFCHMLVTDPRLATKQGKWETL